MEATFHPPVVQIKRIAFISTFQAVSYVIKRIFPEIIFHFWSSRLHTTMEIQSSNESLQQISPSEGSSSAHNINGKGDGSQQEISPNSKDRDLQSQQSDPTSGGPKLLRKRGRPPGRSKRASTSGTIGYLPPVASDFQHDITNMADWKTLPKEQILKKLEALPPGSSFVEMCSTHCHKKGKASRH